ncbi:TIGR02444 family protein [Pseudomonas sp. MYb185]|uniref:TIGR02444 family protein n=1 Tax=Pseudomonas sp. MYb185 TaxID=1848729 RepID=UPI001304E16C|nr:TIGR02444 family protein [Pseudomonas sp. MYb185]
MTGLSDYAGWLYARPGMQTLLLGLQDEAGQDVLLLLTACWLGQRKVPADAQLWRSLQALQAPWRQQVIEPLRQVRRTLATDQQAAALYARVKECELAAEWHQLERLERLCLQLDSSPAETPLDCTRAHLAMCCDGLQDLRLESLVSAATGAGQMLGE